MKVDLSCPIELWEYSLPSAENPDISFTFFNLGDRVISSIQITVTCYDAEDKVLSRRVERPMALDAMGREPFEVTITSGDGAIDSINLSIDKVWFAEGQEWRRQQDVRLVDYEPNELPPNRTLEQLRFIAGDDAVGFPSDQGNVWICICGRVNAAYEATCRRCAREKTEVFEKYSQDAVENAISSREEQLEEKARNAREEASRQEFLRQDKARRKRRARRMRSVVISATVIVAILTYLFVVLGLPELKYQTAKSALAAGDFKKARADFEGLDEYRDSTQMVKETDLRMATEYAHSGQMAQVDEAILMLENLDEYEGAAEMLQEAQYQKGLLYMDDKAYEQAAAQFASLSGMTEADSKRNEALYELGKQEMEAEAYEQAAAHFESLGNYLDAAALAKECVYRPALEAMNAGELDTAAEMFESIAGYKDANEQRMQSIYQAALKAQLAGEYEYAAERFELLGNYEDASEQVKQSIYMAANTARDTGKYETAAKLYASIPGYEDADEQQKAALYTPAVALMTEARYEEAALLFEQVPGYEEADELLLQCVYLPAVAASEAGEYDEAIALFEQIPEYKDAEKLRQQAMFKRAEKLEEDGDLEAAIDAFTAMGDYSGAEDRAKAASYKLAEQAFEAGDFALASERFAALGKYSNAETRVKECAYEIGIALMEDGQLQEAYDALAAIEDYTPARDKAREAAYRLGEAHTAEGDLQLAADAFALAGRYEDAAERRQDSIYQWADTLMAKKDYEQAGALFNSILGYTDARARRDECYDLWLSGEREEANRLYEAEDYQGVIDLLKVVALDDMPKAYADLKTLYLDSNIKLARNLINEDRALEAYGYLIEAQGYRNADELLQKNIYRILGTWESEEGDTYAFYLNGTAILAGEAYYYNMFNPYGISIGKENDPEKLVRAYSYSTGGEKTLHLRIDETDEIIRLTRTKPPEVSATQDSDGAVVLPEVERMHMEEPIVDVIEAPGEADDMPEEEPVEEAAG